MHYEMFSRGNNLLFSWGMRMICGIIHDVVCMSMLNRESDRAQPSALTVPQARSDYARSLARHRVERQVIIIT